MAVAEGSESASRHRGIELSAAQAFLNKFTARYRWARMKTRSRISSIGFNKEASEKKPFVEDGRGFIGDQWIEDE